MEYQFPFSVAVLLCEKKLLKQKFFSGSSLEFRFVLFLGGGFRDWSSTLWRLCGECEGHETGTLLETDWVWVYTEGCTHTPERMKNATSVHVKIAQTTVSNMKKRCTLLFHCSKRIHIFFFCIMFRHLLL